MATLPGDGEYIGEHLILLWIRKLVKLVKTMFSDHRAVTNIEGDETETN